MTDISPTNHCLQVAAKVLRESVRKASQVGIVQIPPDVEHVVIKLVDLKVERVSRSKVPLIVFAEFLTTRVIYYHMNAL